MKYAQAMAIALPDPLATRLTLKRSKSMAPNLDVIVRAHANAEIDVLYQLGAREVVQPEFEAALEMGAHVLLNLGDPQADVSRSVRNYRLSRYRDITPERIENIQSVSMNEAIQGLKGIWHTLKDTSILTGQTIAQSNIRQRTGTTIMAIRRGRELLRYPDPQTMLMAGDRLFLVGDAAEQATFIERFGPQAIS